MPSPPLNAERQAFAAGIAEDCVGHSQQAVQRRAPGILSRPCRSVEHAQQSVERRGSGILSRPPRVERPAFAAAHHEGRVRLSPQAVQRTA